MVDVLTLCAVGLDLHRLIFLDSSQFVLFYHSVDLKIQIYDGYSWGNLKIEEGKTHLAIGASS